MNIAALAENFVRDLVRDEDVYVGLLVCIHESKFFVESLNGCCHYLIHFVFE